MYDSKRARIGQQIDRRRGGGGVLRGETSSAPLTYELSSKALTECWGAIGGIVHSICAAPENRQWTATERESIATVLRELLENTIKYADWTQPRPPSLEFRCYADRTVCVHTSNVVDLDAAYHKGFLAVLDRIKVSRSAKLAYEARTRAIASGSSFSGSVGLGLLRIAYENNCSIEGDFRDGVLMIDVKMRLEKARSL